MMNNLHTTEQLAALSPEDLTEVSRIASAALDATQQQGITGVKCSRLSHINRMLENLVKVIGHQQDENANIAESA